MKTILTIAATLTATAAAAHPGHVAPAAGHTHGEVIALTAIVALAVGALVWNARRS